jgi:hypothetical protein
VQILIEEGQVSRPALYLTMFYHTMWSARIRDRNPMPFDARIRQLCTRLAECKDDVLSLKLAQELQVLLHERIEQIRGEVTGLPLLNRRRQENRHKRAT